MQCPRPQKTPWRQISRVHVFFANTGITPSGHVAPRRFLQARSTASYVVFREESEFEDKSGPKRFKKPFIFKLLEKNMSETFKIQKNEISFLCVLIFLNSFRFLLIFFPRFTEIQEIMFWVVVHCFGSTYVRCAFCRQCEVVAPQPSPEDE